MAWFGDGLSSLSNLKGQITSFTKEVLSDSIIEEKGDRSQQHGEANEHSVQLQDVLSAKDAEITLLRRQNLELQKAVVELNSKSNEGETGKQDDDGGGFFWDPPKFKGPTNGNYNRELEEKFTQTTMKMHDLASHDEKFEMVNSTQKKEEVMDSHEKADFARAKQDMVDSILQIGKKEGDADRIIEKKQLDESTFLNDLRAAISKLNSDERRTLIHSALSTLEIENNATGVDCGKKMNPSKITMNTISKREAELEQKIQTLQEENASLSAGLEELDQQHTESLENLLSLKEELQKKHQSLQNAYEALYVECNEAKSKLQLHESQDAIDEKTTIKDEMVQTEEIGPIEKDNGLTLYEIRNRLKEILKNSDIDEGENETIFETVALRYLDAEWKKEMLERRVSELTRELKETNEIRDAIHMECVDLHNTIDALENDIQYMKSNLPSIPEGNEEFESMSNEIKRLQTEYDILSKKYNDAVLDVADRESSLRKQENLEAELRNTKQQLEIAQQRLDGASKNVENNENMKEDLSRRLHASLDENNDLRNKIHILDTREIEIQEKVVSYEEKCKKLDESEILISKLRLEIDNARQEIEFSNERTEILEREIFTAQEDKKELERDIMSLAQEKEQVEAELALLVHKNGLSDNDTQLLKELQGQLEAANREKDDLEYDLLNMRKELDLALSQLAERESDCLRMNQDNERLERENNTVLEQLNSINVENTERIELLQTEISLLQQEHKSLGEESANDKIELDKIRSKFNQSESQCHQKENMLKELQSNYQSLETEFRSLNQQTNINQEKSTTDRMELDKMTTKFNQSEAQCLEKETMLNELQFNYESLKTNFNSLKQQLNTDQDSLKTAQAELDTLKSKFHELEAKCLEKEKMLEEAKSRCELLENDYQSLKKRADTDREEIKHLISQLSSQNSSSEYNDKVVQLSDELMAVKSDSEFSAAMAKETIATLSQLIKQKDQELADQKMEYGSSLTSLRTERDELVRLVQVKHNESLQYHAEIQRLTQLFSEQTAKLDAINSERDAHENLMKEKEAEVLWAQNELQVVRQRLKNFEELNNYGETCNIAEHASQILQANTLNEKCDALEAALVKEQSSNRILQNQLNECQLRESNAGKELERLRTHLVEMEGSYTEEALLMDQAKQELETKLLQAEEKVKNSSTVYTSASIRANQQVETLQQQMSLIVQQRDEIQAKLSAAEDKVLSHSASLTNLQIVLEQFQRDKENDIRNATEKIRHELNASYKKQEELNAEIVSLKVQLAEAKECLLAASRLSEQLNRKSERIQELNEEVAKLTTFVNTADEKIQEAKKSGEGKVDKSLVKNLLLGLVSSSASDNSSILRVFGTVLDFDDAEREKAGLNNPAAHGGWFSGLMGSGSHPTKDQESSLSAAFVRFLESESKPASSVPALSISNSSISRPGHSRQHSTSSSQSGLLLSNVTLPSFPDFVPSRNTGSILKEILKDS